MLVLYKKIWYVVNINKKETQIIDKNTNLYFIEYKKIIINKIYLTSDNNALIYPLTRIIRGVNITSSHYYFTVLNYKSE